MSAPSAEWTTSKTFTNPVARKMLLAGTGLGLVAFLITHVVGLFSIFGGPSSINASSSALHSVPTLVWPARLLLVVVFLLHVRYAVYATLDNRAARPVAYAKRKYQTSNVLSRSQIWTGLVIALFLVYHLLHFTIQAIDPAAGAASLRDSVGRPDVYQMVVRGLQHPGTSLIYLIAMAAVAAHLSHGIHSALQTFGAATQRTLPLVIKGAVAAAALCFAAFASIPAAVLSGLVKLVR